MPIRQRDVDETGRGDAGVGVSRDLSLASPWFYRAKATHTYLRALWPMRCRGGADESDVRILFYHRVADDSDELAVSPRRFRAHMEYLAENGYEVLDISRLWDALVDGSRAGKAVGLCFDDGYLDVAETALPVLEEFGFHATVFIATAATDGAATFTWYEEQPPLIGWDEIAQLDRSGTLRFEAHTMTHPNLLDLDDATARDEIAGSKRVLEERLGRSVDVFCYPAGLFGEREQRYVRESGFRLAVSCEPGVNALETDNLALRRIQIDARDGQRVFRAKVNGGFDVPSRLRAWYRKRRYSVDG